MVRILRPRIKIRVRGALWLNRGSWVTREQPAPPDRREWPGLRERKVRRASWVIRAQPVPLAHREWPDLRGRKVRRASWVIQVRLARPDLKEWLDLRVRKGLLVRRDLPGPRDRSHWRQ
jgi:hypothetical protein